MVIEQGREGKAHVFALAALCIFLDAPLLLCALVLQRQHLGLVLARLGILRARLAEW